jgi:hypothetical protein
VLVARIARHLGLALSPGLHPEPADHSHGDDHHPNKHACLLRGAGQEISKGEAELPYGTKAT